jgi:hypothetical protein
VIVLAVDHGAEGADLLAAVLARDGAKLVSIDPEETAEVDLDNVPEGMRSNARPADGVLAASGRMWIAETVPETSNSPGKTPT